MQSHREIPELTTAENDRFMRFVDRSGTCHLWTGSRDKHGRGRFSLRLYPTLAPRIAYRIENGRDPGGMSVLHSCDNPRCVNPAHLKLGTQADNLQDAMRKGRVARGERVWRGRGSGKLTEERVRTIKRAILAGGRTSDLAAEYGIGPAQISSIKHNHKWSWVNV